MKYIYLYLIAIAIFFVIDMAWLGWFAKDFYFKKLDFILAEKTNWAAAIIFYFLYIIGILYFAVLPSFEDGEWQTALVKGALFGFFCYATYELTNMALVENWPLDIVIVDILWGTFLTGAVATLAHLFGDRFLAF